MHDLILSAALVAALAPTAAAQNPVFTFLGSDPGDWLGAAVRNAGDVDADGIADLIVGAPLADPNGRSSGLVRVHSGATGAVIYQFVGAAEGDEHGASVSGAGDVNADGFADLIIGAPGADTPGGIDAGRAQLRDGRTGAVLAHFDGYTPGARLGTSVSGAGDVNGDGYDDVVLGAPFDEDGPPYKDCGSIRLVSGKTGLNLYVAYGFSKFAQLGWSVSGAGDVDGDGYADFIAGAPFDFANGQYGWGIAYVFSGKSLNLVSSPGGNAYGSQFGFSVSGAGDVDGDGFDDVIVGAPNDASGGVDAGRATVFSLAKDKVLLDVVGPLARAKLGAAVSGLGDVNGDGFADVLIGAPHHGIAGGSYNGMVWLFSGSGSGWLRTWSGQPGDRLGASLSSAGDLVGDSRPEVFLGARMHDAAGSNAGAAFVHRAD